jgi:hypothetical protein
MTEQNKQPPAEAGEGALIAPMIWISKSNVDWAKSGVANGYGQFSFVNRDEYEIPMTLFAPVKKYAAKTTATQAAVAVAKREAARIVHSFTGLQEATRNHLIERLLSSIPAEANAALRELMMDCISAGYDAGYTITDGTKDEAIARIIAEKGLK